MGDWFFAALLLRVLLCNLTFPDFSEQVQVGQMMCLELASYLWLKRQKVIALNALKPVVFVSIKRPFCGSTRMFSGEGQHLEGDYSGDLFVVLSY